SKWRSSSIGSGGVRRRTESLSRPADRGVPSLANNLPNRGRREQAGNRASDVRNVIQQPVPNANDRAATRNVRVARLGELVFEGLKLDRRDRCPSRVELWKRRVESFRQIGQSLLDGRLVARRHRTKARIHPLLNLLANSNTVRTPSNDPNDHVAARLRLKRFPP